MRLAARLDRCDQASVDDPDWFWRAVVGDLGIDFDEPFRWVLDDGAGKPFPRWFPGGRLNAAPLCSHRHAAGPRADKAAVLYEGDTYWNRWDGVWVHGDLASVDDHGTWRIRSRYLDEVHGDLSSLDPATPIDDIPVLARQGEGA
jgi:hypothetical protein